MNEQVERKLLLEVNHLGVRFKIKNDKSLFFAKPVVVNPRWHAPLSAWWKLLRGKFYGLAKICANNRQNNGTIPAKIFK